MAVRYFTFEGSLGITYFHVVNGVRIAEHAVVEIRIAQKDPPDGSSLELNITGLLFHSAPDRHALSPMAGEGSVSDLNEGIDNTDVVCQMSATLTNDESSLSLEGYAIQNDDSQNTIFGTCTLVTYDSAGEIIKGNDDGAYGGGNNGA